METLSHYFVGCVAFQIRSQVSKQHRRHQPTSYRRTTSESRVAFLVQATPVKYRMQTLPVIAYICSARNYYSYPELPSTKWNFIFYVWKCANLCCNWPRIFCPFTSFFLSVHLVYHPTRFEMRKPHLAPYVIVFYGNLHTFTSINEWSTVYNYNML